MKLTTQGTDQIHVLFNHFFDLYPSVPNVIMMVSFAHVQEMLTHQGIQDGMTQTMWLMRVKRTNRSALRMFAVPALTQCSY